MVSMLELGLALVVLVALYLVYRTLKAWRTLIVNAIVGLVLLIGVELAGLAVDITVWAVLVCALGGLPGALLVMLLAWLEVAFVPALVVFVG